MTDIEVKRRLFTETLKAYRLGFTPVRELEIYVRVCWVDEQKTKIGLEIYNPPQFASHRFRRGDERKYIDFGGNMDIELLEIIKRKIREGLPHFSVLNLEGVIST